MTSTKRDTGRFLRDLDFLSDLTRETLSSLELGTLLRRVVVMMRHRFGYDYSAVALVEGARVVFHEGSGGILDNVFGESRRQYAWEIPVGKGVVGKAVALARPHMVNRVDEDPDYIKVDFLSQTRSELTVPLIHRGQVLGVLDVQSNQPDAFNENDLRLLEIVAALVAPAVHTSRLFEWERRRARHLHLVGEISRLVMSSLDQKIIISVTCESIIEALGCTFAGIALLDRSHSRLVHAGHASKVPLLVDQDLSAEVGKGLVGTVVAAGRSINVPNVESFPDFMHVVPDMRSALCVPLQVREGIIGVVEVEHDVPGYFTAHDESLLVSLAAYLGQAMENAQLFESQRRRWQQLLVINEVTRVATETFDLDAILDLVAKEIHDRFEYFAVAVMLADERAVEIRAVRCDEPLDRGVGHSIPLGEGIAGQVARSGEVAVVGRVQQQESPGALRRDVRSILCVPLRARKQIIGVIQVQSLAEDAFDQDDRLLLETLAESVAGAIANARLIRQNEEFREDLNQMIVHDLRNPIQSVLLTLQEVQRVAEERLSAGVNEALKEGIARTEDILEMVNSLLDVSRFEAGKAQLRLTPAAINDHIRMVISRFGLLLRSKRIQVKTTLSDEIPVVWIDHELVNRTLDNIIGNAVKFTDEGGVITVTSELLSEPARGCASAGQHVRVSVQNTGEGIPPEFQEKIFEKFGQVETRKAGLKMSTGLGLALCRYVVEAHGGSIWVESQARRGAAFHFTLPVGRRP